MFTTRSSPSVGQAASLPCHDRSPSSKIASWPLDIRRVSYLSTGPKPCIQHHFRRVKKLPWKCSGISSYTQARDNARAETKTNHSRRSPAPVRAKSPVQNRSLAPATADCCPPLRQARPRQRSSPNRPSGHTSAFPDTPRDHSHVTPQLGATARISPWNFTVNFRSLAARSTPDGFPANPILRSRQILLDSQIPQRQ